MKTNNPYMNGERIFLGGHRGDRKHFPENTMPAMRAAVEMGCDAIETDVRRTKDGHLVLIHDRDVLRTTNGQGFVDEMTLEEILSDPTIEAVTVETEEIYLTQYALLDRKSVV